MVKPYIIGIAGESGVGKSTIAEIVTLFFEIKNTLTISTDDLHKWERSNSNWETITHLNPNANNLELGDIHLRDLSKGKFIYRSIYNHKTGNFDPPKKIEPKKNVIIEGLHAFYTDESKKLIDLKIFIDTDEDLRTHWKIIRDTEERGYKYNKVLDTINKRKTDSANIREAQIGIADAVISIYPSKKILCLGDKNEKIDLNLSISIKNNVNKELFDFVKYYVDEFNNFVKLSETFGQDIALCQNGGGNISVKVSPKHMIIKSSGFALKDVYKLKGYSVIDYKNFKFNKIKNDDSLNLALTNSPLFSKYKKPSMETGFHISLKEKYIIHLHPIYITLLLCLVDSQNIIQKLYYNQNYQYIKYVNPGFKLCKTIANLKQNSNIYFLENHGIILASNDLSHINTLIDLIEITAKNYIREKFIELYDINEFKTFDLSFSNYNLENKYTFPDAAIFLDNKKEILAAHNYISFIGNKIGKLRYLSKNNINILKKLESEKYRGKL